MRKKQKSKHPNVCSIQEIFVLVIFGGLLLMIFKNNFFSLPSFSDFPGNLLSLTSCYTILIKPIDSSLNLKTAYHLQRGELQDFPEIVEVWEASVRATHHFLTEEDILFFKPLILQEYLGAIDLWIALNQQHKIVGFLGVSDDSIEMLFIHPDDRGKGIGKLLIHHAIHALQACKVEVNEQNEQAVGFYEKMGFVLVSRSAQDSMGKPYPILHMELVSPTSNKL